MPHKDHETGDNGNGEHRQIDAGEIGNQQFQRPGINLHGPQEDCLNGEPYREVQNDPDDCCCDTLQGTGNASGLLQALDIGRSREYPQETGCKGRPEGNQRSDSPHQRRGHSL